MTPLEQEMLAALKKAKPMVAAYIGDSETLCLIENAIAKAEPKQRRWLVEETADMRHTRIFIQEGDDYPRVKVIREVKPITRGRIENTILGRSYAHPVHLENFIRELGIDVEDCFLL